MQFSAVRESVLGTTPNTPRMRQKRFTGESLQFKQTFVDSDEVRSDRMTGDPIKVFQDSEGSFNAECWFPNDNSPESDDLRSAFYNTWTNTPAFDNDGTADSVITDAGTAANTYVVASGGAAVKANHLVRATGFTNAANNQVFAAVAGSGTTVVGAALGLVAEVAPPGTARLKVVGFAGAAGDITAAAGGLASSVLDFTTLGLTPGQFIKIGGAAAGNRFAGTPANNDWARISGPVTAHAIPLDNKPAGWGVDAAAGKTIWVFFGDYINNGITQTGQSIERGFMDQAVPTYIVNKGMVVDTYDVAITSKQKLQIGVAYLGMDGAQSTVALDAAIDAATTGLAMAANVNVGRIGEGGAQLTSPNWIKELKFQINNNNRQLDAADNSAPVGVNPGECTVTGSLSAYFGDNTLLAKFYAGTPSAVSSRVAKNNQALVWQLPRITYNGDGNPNASGKNTDVMLGLQFKASIDTTLTLKHIWLDRLEYFEV